MLIHLLFFSAAFGAIFLFAKQLCINLRFRSFCSHTFYLVGAMLLLFYIHVGVLCLFPVENESLALSVSFTFILHVIPIYHGWKRLSNSNAVENTEYRTYMKVHCVAANYLALGIGIFSLSLSGYIAEQTFLAIFLWFFLCLVFTFHAYSRFSKASLILSTERQYKHEKFLPRWIEQKEKGFFTVTCEDLLDKDFLYSIDCGVYEVVNRQDLLTLKVGETVYVRFSNAAIDIFRLFDTER